MSTIQPNTQAIDILMNSYDVSYLDQLKQTLNWDSPTDGVLKLLQHTVVAISSVVLYPLQEANRWMNAGSFEKMTKEVVQLQRKENQASQGDDIALKAIIYKNEAVVHSLVGRLRLVVAQNSADARDILHAAHDAIAKQTENGKDETARLVANKVLAEYQADRVKMTFPGFDFSGSFLARLESEANVLVQMGLCHNNKEEAKAAILKSWKGAVRKLTDEQFKEVTDNLLKTEDVPLKDLVNSNVAFLTELKNKKSKAKKIAPPYEPNTIAVNPTAQYIANLERELAETRGYAGYVTGEAHKLEAANRRLAQHHYALEEHIQLLNARIEELQQLESESLKNNSDLSQQIYKLTEELYAANPEGAAARCFRRNSIH